MSTEKISFLEKWKNERKQGLRRYYMKHIGGILAILIGIVAGDSIAHKGLNFEFLIIAIIVAGFFPATAWLINEMRYKISIKSGE